MLFFKVSEDLKILKTSYIIPFIICYRRVQTDDNAVNVNSDIVDFSIVPAPPRLKKPLVIEFQPLSVSSKTSLNYKYKYLSECFSALVTLDAVYEWNIIKEAMRFGSFWAQWKATKVPTLSTILFEQ